MPVNLFIPRELSGEQLPKAIEFLRAFDSASSDANIIDKSPLFLFSAGWRSGSTLLQRLVCSDSSVLIWGEPYGDRIPVPRLAATIADFHSNDSTIKYAVENFHGKMSEEWIANLNPGPKSLRSAHLAYFENLFANQAQLKGFNRWGAKWVRLSAYYAFYLQWLYPQAKFVFLVRHPLSAYHSYKRKKWFAVKPYFRVNNIFKFMLFWNYLTTSFIQYHRGLNGMLIRYEDLIMDKQLISKLSDFLGIHINQDVLDNRVGSRDKKKLNLNLFEKFLCKLITSSIYQKIGYNHNP